VAPATDRAIDDLGGERASLHSRRLEPGTIVRVQDRTFRVPDPSRPVDLEGHVRLLPGGATCKGLFFTDVIARARRVAPGVDVAARAGLASRRYVAFFAYPYADLLRLVVAAASVMYPDVPTGEGVRRVGEHAYDALLGTQAGRVVFGLFGGDAEFVMMQGPRGYSIALNFGEITVEREGPRRVRYRFRGLPGFIETYQVGVIEGALRHCGATCDARVALTDLANGDIQVDWD
jgi:uncharacterized protein (TIGR02265 family)